MSKWVGWKFLEANVQLAISEMKISFAFKIICLLGVSSQTTSSLILKSIRQRLIEGTINTVNRSLCNYTRNQ